MRDGSLKVDFHCHTRFSPDSLNDLQALINQAKRKGLGKIVITDHNTIQGALHARQLDEKFVIVGEEIKTTRGELLACFVNREVPKGLHPLEAIEMLRSQGAFISVSHPFDRLRSGWELDDLERITPLVDAIEIFNARVVRPGMNDEALAYAAQHQLAGTAGSDAHSLLEIGAVALDLPDFDDADTLRAAIRQGKVVGKVSPAWVHLTSTWAKLVKRMDQHQ